ncbi:MAG: metalloregulator ArsR/SmtB family transcription factor [Scytolyngbya sp. HA4215-MV1]|jgi:DNA-binding transcriptional ArsR family regulator|nr:metalloregulator ArsR/SmtB family transcription factor [Scytolyngbya sp. HA4215-MV1]
MLEDCDSIPIVPPPISVIGSVEQRAKIFSALSDPTRLRIVELLAANKEMSGSEIATQVGISLALFCHHSRILLEAGLIRVRKEGQTKYNALNQDVLARCLASLKA